MVLLSGDRMITPLPADPAVTEYLAKLFGSEPVLNSRGAPVEAT